MVRLFLIVCLIFSSQFVFANRIAEMFKEDGSGENFWVEIQEESSLSLLAFIPRNFQIAYAPENLATCEFIPRDQSTENWSEKIVISCYENAQLTEAVVAYDSFIQGIGGDETSAEFIGSHFDFGDDIRPVHYVDYVHTGPHVLPRIKLRSSTESEIAVSRFIPGNCGVLQVMYIAKLDNEVYEKQSKEIIAKGKALVENWKVVSQEESDCFCDCLSGFLWDCLEDCADRPHPCL